MPGGGAGGLGGTRCSCGAPIDLQPGPPLPAANQNHSTEWEPGGAPSCSRRPPGDLTRCQASLAAQPWGCLELMTPPPPPNPAAHPTPRHHQRAVGSLQLNGTSTCCRCLFPQGLQVGRAQDMGGGRSWANFRGERACSFQPKKENLLLRWPGGVLLASVSTLCSTGTASDSRVLLTRGRNGRCSVWYTVGLTIWLVSVDGRLFIGVLQHQMLPRFLGIDPRPLKSRIYGLTACWPYFKGQDQCFCQVLEKGESLTRRDGPHLPALGPALSGDGPS